MVKNMPNNAGDASLVPGSGGSPGGGKGNSLQYSFLEIPWIEEPGRLYSPRQRRESGTTEHTHKYIL